MKVFLLQHTRESEDDCEHTKVIGVYSTADLAEAALERVRNQAASTHNATFIPFYALRAA